MILLDCFTAFAMTKGGKRAGKFTSLVIASKAERRRVAIQLIKIPAECAWVNLHARSVHSIHLDPMVKPWGDNID